MDKLVIEGGKPLYGEVSISGAKNAALPLLAATMLCPGQHILRNVPDLRDTRTIIKLLESFGSECRRIARGVWQIELTDITNFEAAYDLVKTMRASVLVLGPLLARFGVARVSLPGGCAIGARPIDFHLQALQKMGAELILREGYVEAKCHGRLSGADICFDIPSVTGTENILMAAALARGVTVIKNAAREPEIGNLIDMLRAMGADIKGRGTDILSVNGVAELQPADTKIIPDRIETGTYLIAVGAAGGEIIIKDCNPAHLPALLEKMRAAGLVIEEGKNTLKVCGSRPLNSIDIKTMPYPGFPTDLQAQVMALMTLTDGLSVINETIFENRFMHVAELRRMGANIKVDGRSAIVKGCGGLTGARVMATDLRASASLVVAGLAARGVTEISRIYHLERGYDNLAGKLTALGAVIRQVKE
ncbi:MAG: UDP-N-acetylglucosamine 1-carboxyvinyltransferase [Deltaproteobacteria bacterium]|nr:UDP-N-acetylglucosamine 1-carboxyvinyltransferase [Deltaproteobacteria bacterium]